MTAGLVLVLSNSVIMADEDVRLLLNETVVALWQLLSQRQLHLTAGPGIEDHMNTTLSTNTAPITTDTLQQDVLNLICRSRPHLWGGAC